MNSQCICDAYGMCPDGCAHCDVCSGSDLTLAEFLAARLDEDEAAAKMATPMWMPREVQIELDDPEHYAFRATTITPSVAQHIARHDPARVLREVQAGRKILELHLPDDPDEYGRIRCQRCDETAWPCSTLRALTAVHSDHPDYREKWRS